MSNQEPTGCCPPFDPSPWDEKEITLTGRHFIKDRVLSFFHVPLNFGAVMRSNMRKIESAGLCAENGIVLTDERSLWGADVYIEVTGDLPGATMAGFDGSYLSKVFEGSYRDMRKWIAAMGDFVGGRGKSIQKLLFCYTTCPRCAKKYGKNYVAILARTEET